MEHHVRARPQRWHAVGTKRERPVADTQAAADSPAKVAVAARWLMFGDKPESPAREFARLLLVAALADPQFTGDARAAAQQQLDQIGPGYFAAQLIPQPR